MTSLKQKGEKFDVIILDPPAFITRRKDHKNGLLAYRRANELAMRLLNREGLLVSGSCSMHLSREELVDVVRGASRHIDRSAQIVHQGHQGGDHPIHPAIPETEYLKTVFVRVLPA
jgi:23S rRNA (cytosine1962-C5)-methyltransferase